MQVGETSQCPCRLRELWEKGVLCDEVQIAGRCWKERVWTWGWGWGSGVVPVEAEKTVTLETFQSERQRGLLPAELPSDDGTVSNSGC